MAARRSRTAKAPFGAPRTAADGQHVPGECVDHGADPERAYDASDPREVDHPDVVGALREEHAAGGTARDLGFRRLPGTSTQDPLDARPGGLDAQARELAGDLPRAPLRPLDLEPVDELVNQIRETAQGRQEVRVLPARHTAPVEDCLHAEYEDASRILDAEPVPRRVPEDVHPLVAAVVGATGVGEAEESGPDQIALRFEPGDALFQGCDLA